MTTRSLILSSIYIFTQGDNIILNDIQQIHGLIRLYYLEQSQKTVQNSSFMY